MNKKKKKIKFHRIRLASLLIVFTLFFTGQVLGQTIESLRAPLTFFMLNDMGRNGYYRQQPMAETIGEMAEVIGPECIIAAGDIHHFDGVQSTQDPLWLTDFEMIYRHPELMIAWHPVCGNHEYRGNTKAVLDYSQVSRRWQMPEKYYTLVYNKKGVSVRIVWLDTTPLISRYRKNQETYPDAAKEDDEKQLQWLDETLQNAKEQWIIVVGHHPIYAYTNKPKSERTDMQQRVDTILRRYAVDIYACGHIHTFQHIQHKGSDIDYVVNSSPSLARTQVEAIEGTKFYSADEGFSVISATKETLVLSMVNYEGKIIHQITRKK